MKSLNKFVTVLAKIAEVCLWVGAGLMVAVFITSLVAPDKLRFLVDTGSVTIHGFSIERLEADGNLIGKALTMIGLAGMFNMPLSAMVCRNIHLIFKTAEGQTSFSRGRTPFQPAIVRMVREIGIFSIAIPIVELLISFIAQLVIGSELAETSVSTDGIFFGLVILCLSQFFAYGASLQEEVDGLL